MISFLPLPQLPHLPHKKLRFTCSVGIFNKRQCFFQNRPRDDFGEADIERFMLVISKRFGEINTKRLKLTRDVFVFYGIELLEDIADGLHDTSETGSVLCLDRQEALFVQLLFRF